jgi:methionyl-tRNA formyltransferase
MKIVVFIRRKPPLFYFANAIHKVFPLSLVVIENPHQTTNEDMTLAQKTKHYLKHKGVKNIPRSIKSRLKNRRYKQTHAARQAAYHAAEKKYFGDLHASLDPSMRVLEVKNINSYKVKEALEQIKPDVLLDHGTSIVKSHILDTAPLALNIHWGLSPYYRGTVCTQWALLQKDPLNIGVTVHKLSKHVDGGDILGQARAQIAPDDYARTINMQLTKLGTDIVLQALKKLAHGEQLQFHKQDLSVGVVTATKQWTLELEKKIWELEEHGGIASMLSNPAKNEEPILHL